MVSKHLLKLGVLAARATFWNIFLAVGERREGGRLCNADTAGDIAARTSCSKNLARSKGAAQT